MAVGFREVGGSVGRVGYIDRLREFDATEGGAIDL